MKQPLGARLKARSLYLDGLGYTEISEKTLIPRDELRHIAFNEKWRLLRESPEARAEAQRATQAALAEWNDRLSLEAQSLSIDAVPVVRDAIDRGSARDLKDSAQGLKTLVEIARITSGIGDKDTQAPCLGAGVNLFFFSGKAERIERDVTPVAVENAIAQRVVDDPEF